ncbi:ZN517 protein, partial [Spizella passerina]|nr:ZN517 protein [Spizella passerina]
PPCPHPSAQPFVCGDCGHSFSLSSKLSQHHRVHSRKQLYTCGGCSKSFTRSLTLIAHWHSHTG